MTFEEPHLIEEHAEHHLVGLFRQVGQEEDLVGGCVVHVATTTSMTTSLVQAATYKRYIENK